MLLIIFFLSPVNSANGYHFKKCVLPFPTPFFFRLNVSVSLIAFTTMALLTIMEFTVYQDTWMKYEYEVDKDFTR